MTRAAVLVVALATAAAAADPVDHQGRHPEADSIACESCKVLTKVAQAFASSEITAEVGEAIAAAYCEHNHGAIGWTCKGTWACRDLCENAVRTWGGEAIYIGAHLLLDPETDCVKLGACPNTSKPADESLPPFQPAAPAARRPYPTSAAPSDIYRVAHVTDIHWDPEYYVGGNADCGEPLCCRQVQGPPSGANTTCGYYANHAGDTSETLLHTMYEAVAALKPDFAFFTGDDPPHNVWNQTREYNTGVSLRMTALIEKYLGATPVYFALGNHNGFPVNQFNTDPTKDEEWLYGPLADAYARWLPEEALATFRKAGYYTAPVRGAGGLRVISLNTGLQNHDNWWTMLNSDANLANMTTWLDASLAAARAAGERVFILGHHPPNGNYWADWMEGFFQPLLREYRDTVVGMFFGHTHTAQVQLAFSSDNDTQAEAIVAGYVGAAPTPYGGINPTFRIYDVDRATGNVVDYHDYRVDVDAQGLATNTDPNQPPPRWEKAYSARDAYGMPSLAPEEWHRLADRIRTDDDLFHRWEANFATGNPSRMSFDSHERARRVCDILGGTSSLFHRCLSAASA